MIRSRSLLLAVFAAAWTLAWAAGASAQTVRIGLILTTSGPNSTLGEMIDRGVRLYVAQHEKDLAPVRLEILRRDDTGPNPDIAKRLAQELIVRDKVSLLAGVVFTPNVAAIAPLTAEAKVPLVIMNAGTSSLTTLSPYITRFSFTVWQVGYPLGQWAAKSGIRTAYTAVSDFSGGIDYEQAFVRGFADAGGKVAGSVRMPLASPDFVPYLQRIKDARPDALYVFVPGGRQATQFMKAFTDLGLDTAGIRLLGPGDITTDEELPNMGDVRAGVITAHHYSAASTRPENREFLAAWRKMYGADSTPSYMAVAGYDGMAAIFSVIREQHGVLDPARTMALLRRYRDAASPRGTIEIDPETRDIVQDIQIRRLEREDGKLINREFERIPAQKDLWKVFNPQPDAKAVK